MVELLKDDYKNELWKEEFNFNSIVNIDLALSRNCNRAGLCGWCPNSLPNKKEDEIILSDNDLKVICNKLREANFKGGISLNRYNEPFLLPSLADKIKIIYEYLPDVNVSCNTNSSIINKIMLKETAKAGMKEYRMQIYPDNINEIEVFNSGWIEKKLHNILSKLDVKLDKSKTMIIEGYYYEYNAVFPDNWEYLKGKPNLRIYAKNLDKLGCDRAGSVDKLKSVYTRTNPCEQIGKFLAIDPDGNVSICTNYTGKMLGIKEHEQGIVGNIITEPLMTIQKKLIPLIYDLSLYFSKDNLEKYKMCKNCSFEPHAMQINKLIANEKLMQKD